MSEEQLEVEQIIRILGNHPSFSVGNDFDTEKYHKAIILEKKEASKIKDNCKYKFKLQLVEYPDQVLKVRLSEITWKPSKKRSSTEEENLEGEKKEKKQKKKKKECDETSTSLSTSTSFSLDPFRWKRSIPPAVLKYIVAPMVGASELPFRLLCRRYGATLAYTPMINSERFAVDESYRQEEFQTTPEDRPLVAHFCANNPEFFLNAVKHVEHHCDAIGK
jgi:hypothetical protein